MRRRSRASTLATLAGLALTLTSAGCNKPAPEGDPSPSATSSTPATEPSPEPPTSLDAPLGPVPAAMLAELTALGDRGAAVVVLRDAGWSDAAALLVDLFAGRSPFDGETASSPEWVLRWLGQRIDLPLASAELAGRDHARPILLSLHEAPVDGPITAVTTAQPLTEPLRGIRHQVLIPATDVDAALASVGVWLAALPAWPELVADRPGAKAWRSPTGLVAAVPEQGRLRVVIVEGSHGIPTTELDRWRAELDTPAAAPVETPALRLLGQPSASVAMLVRPWRLRAVYAHSGLVNAHAAIATAPADMHPLLFVAATQEVLFGELAMADGAPEIDDWAVSGGLSHGAIRVRGLASLTPLGREMIAAGRAGAPPPLRLTDPDVIAYAWATLDSAAMLALATPANATRAAHFDLRRGGVGVLAHAGLRAPIATLEQLRGATPAADKVLTQAHVRGLQYVELRPTAEQPERRAIALLLRPGDRVPAALLAGALRGLLRIELESSSAERGDTPVVLLGHGVDPATVFDLARTPEPEPALAEFQLDLAALVGLADRQGVGQLATLAGRVGDAGPALAFELVFGDRRALGFAPELGDVSWASPIRSPSGSADACLEQAGYRVLDTLAALTRAAPDQHAQLRSAAALELEADLACIGDDPDAKAAADRLRGLVRAEPSDLP